MANSAKRDTAEMRYILGELSEDEKTRVEEAFFADDSKFYALELAEDELIDAYVRKELSPEELRQFKVKLSSSPRLFERVNFASALAEKADSFQTDEATAPLTQMPTSRAETTQRWWSAFFTHQPRFGMAVAAPVLLLLIGGGLLLSGWLRLRSESGRLANEWAQLQKQKEELDKQSAAARQKIDAENARLQKERDDLAKEPNLVGDENINKRREATNKSLANTLATALLSSASVRSGDSGTRELTIRPETTTAELRIQLDKYKYPTYNVILETPEETRVVHQRRLTPRKTRSGPQLIVSLPFRRLPSNEYTVLVEGVTTAGLTQPLQEFTFRLRKLE